MGPWQRIEVRVALARDGRRRIRVHLSVRHDPIYPPPHGTQPPEPLFLSSWSVRHEHLIGALAKQREHVAAAIASFPVLQERMLRVSVAIKGSKSWTRRLRMLAWPQILAGWSREAVIVVEGGAPRRRPALRLPFELTVPDDELAPNVIDPLVARVEKSGWEWRRTGGHVVHIDDARSIATWCSLETRLVILPLAETSTREARAVVRDRRANVLAVAEPAGEPTFSRQFYRGMFHDAPLDACVYEAMQRSKVSAEHVRLDLLEGGEQDLRPRTAVIEQMTPDLPALLVRDAATRPGARALSSTFARAIPAAEEFAAVHSHLDGRNLPNEPDTIEAVRMDYEAVRATRRSVERAAEAIAPIVARREDYTRLANLWWQSSAGEPLAVDAPLVVGAEYELAFAVEEHARSAAASASLRDAELRHFFAGRDTIDVDVVFFAPSQQVAIEHPRQPLALPRYGDSPIVTTRAKPLRAGVRAVRAGLFYRGHLLQSVVLHARAIDSNAPSAGTSARTCAEVDWACAADLDLLAKLPAPGRTFFVNEDPDGAHWIGAYAADGGPIAGVAGPWVVTPPPQTIDDRARTARNALGRIAGSRDANGNLLASPVYAFNSALSIPAVRKARSDDIVSLARTGRAMYADLIETAVQAPARTAAEALDDLEQALAPAQRIVQIARCHGAGTTVPWAMLYDLPLDPAATDQTLCSIMAADLATPTPSLLDNPAACVAQSTCPLRGPDAAKTVCPFGFWGLRHEIEQPSFQIAPGERPAPQVVKVVPSETTVGMSAFSFPEVPAHAASIQHSTSMLGPKYARADVLALLATGGHALYYFFVHGDTTQNGFALRVGAETALDYILPGSLQLGRAARAAGWALDDWRRRAPIVFVNGCDTVAFDASVVSEFIRRFRALGASGVIGTDIEVFPALAVEAGAALIASLAQGKPLGEAMLAMRRRMMTQLNPLGLVYASYASALTHIHAPGCWCTNP
jgi:hypothetical protein